MIQCLNIIYLFPASATKKAATPFYLLIKWVQE